MNFENKKISELNIELIDGDRGKNYPKNSEIKEKGFCLFLNAKNVTSNDFNFNELNYISEEKDKLLRNGKIKRKDIILTTRGTVGNVAYYSNKIPYENMRINSGMIIIRCSENLNEKYLYWYMKSKMFQNQIKELQTGSAQPQLPISIIKNMNIKICQKHLQNKIVKVLDIIQQKIDLNTHTNNNLYKIFRNIYKNTFSNKNCNFIKFKDYKDIGTLIMGQSPKGSSYNEKGVGLPLINGAADYKDGMLNSNKYTSEPTRVCNPKDLVFCIRATIGQLTIADQKYCLGRGVACISNINEIYYEYVFNIIEDSIDKLKAVATGSVILGLSKDDINNLEVYQPMFEEIEKFHKLEQPILKKIIDIKEQNKVLEQLRDTLLPKLMNGEIDLDKVEI
jgi:type I restriction enzyme S subunit